MSGGGVDIMDRFWSAPPVTRYASFHRQSAKIADVILQDTCDGYVRRISPRALRSRQWHARHLLYPFHIQVSSRSMAASVVVPSDGRRLQFRLRSLLQ